MVFCLHVPLKRKDMLVESCFFFFMWNDGMFPSICLTDEIGSTPLISSIFLVDISWCLWECGIFSDLFGSRMPGVFVFFSDGRWTIWWMSSLKLSPPWLQLHYLRISVLILGWDSQVAAKIVVGKGVGKQMTRSRWLQKEAAFLKVLIPWIWGAKALMGLLVWF